VSAPNVYRPGGPVALVTNRCLFSFSGGRFTLASVHPGHTVEEVIENTGFEFDQPPGVPETPPPSPAALKLMREVVAPQLAEVYPQFAAQVFGVGQAAFAG
jgi:glutaconate CoA-transferase subunit B